MNRQEVYNMVTTIKDNYILLELPTGFGKTKLALDWIKGQKLNNPSILVVIPKLVLIETWKQEIDKWGYKLNIQFTTYVSFPKWANKWDIVIFDEVHHLSDRCIDSLDTFIIRKGLLLSATVKRDKKWQLKAAFPFLKCIKVSAREAIEEEILPDPKVILLPLELDNERPSFEIIYNKNKGNEIHCSYKERWKYKMQKLRKVIVHCTQKQYYDDISSLIQYYKNRIYDDRMKNLYLHKCGERLKWLSAQKTDIVSYILAKLKDKRTLTFCNSIEQTEELGRYCINSKNKESQEILERFNNHKIKHITACAMLDEGVNLRDCQYGIFANLNSSERMQKQRLGRLLRHKNPVIILPYFKNTRDEEIIENMKQDYNPELIQTVNLDGINSGIINLINLKV